MPSKLPDNLLKEIFIRDERFSREFGEFRAHYNDIKVLTPKFYSKYEGRIIKPNPAFQNIVTEKYTLTKDKRDWPETTNQWYGWFNKPFAEDSRLDDRLYFPKESSDIVKHQLLLRKQEAIFKGR